MRRARGRRSLAWAALEGVVTLLAALVSTIWAGRLIGPGDFGIASLVVLVGTLGEVLVAAMFVDPLIRRRDRDRRTLDAAFTAMIATALVVYVAMLLAAPGIARAFDAPDVTALLAVQGLTVVLLAVRGVAEAELARKLRFRSLSLRTVAGKLAFAAVAIALAARGAGAWSLVCADLAFAIVATVAMVRATSLRPRLAFDPARVRGLLASGVPNLVDAVLWTATPRLYLVLVGRALGLPVLGQLGMAFRMNDTVVALLGSVSARVALPMFARVAHDPPRRAAAWRDGTRAIFLVAAPAFLGLACIGPELVPLVLGPAWPVTIDALVAVCVFSVFNFARVLAQPLVKAVGRSSLLVPPHAVELGFLVVACTMAPATLPAQFGVWAAFGVVHFAASAWMLSRAAGIGWDEQLRPLASALAPSLLLGAALWAVRVAGRALPDDLLLVAQIAVGATVYAAVLAVTGRRFLRTWLTGADTGPASR